MAMSIESVVSDIIAAIGEPDFAAVAAGTLCALAEFDLAAVVAHRPHSRSRILHENFGAIGHRAGLDTYARRTCRFNPMLRGASSGAMRARDYRGRFADIPESMRPHLIEAPREELGFRTVGWPERQEEIGVYFPGWGGTIEIGLYRERSGRPARARLLRALGELAGPVGAAFERHRLLAPASRPTTSGWPARTGVLSAREDEICRLLLAGCSSDAIALRLSLSRHTVKDHRKSIFRKLGISALAELFALAR